MEDARSRAFDGQKVEGDFENLKKELEDTKKKLQYEIDALKEPQRK